MSEAENLYGEEHIRRYRETRGNVGHIWREGSTVLLLTVNDRQNDANVEVQAKDDVFQARPRAAQGEREQLWRKANEVWRRSTSTRRRPSARFRSWAPSGPDGRSPA